MNNKDRRSNKSETTKNTYEKNYKICNHRYSAKQNNVGLYAFSVTDIIKCF